MANKSVQTSRKNVKNRVMMDNSIMSSHFGSIRKYEVFSVEEQKELFNIWKNKKGTPEGERAKNLIIMSNQRFVVSLAKKYANENNVLDLINEANLGFIEGLETYDETKGSNILSWTMNYMRRNILYYIGGVEPLVRNGNAAKVMLLKPKAENRFFQREGRNPTPGELMDEINVLDKSFKVVSESDVVDIDYFNIDNTYDFDNDDKKPMISSNDEKLGKYSYSTNDYEEVIESEGMKAVVLPLLNSLNQDNRTIIKMSFGIDEKRPYQDWEIAHKLGKSENYIRTKKAQILKKLSEKFSYDAVYGISRNS